MRLLVSNPDTLGDMVLRQPMYRALLDAGHALLLIVRPAVAPLVPHVAPGARVLELPREVYAADVAARWDEFAKTFAAAREFNPDALVIAPYRWTLFDERLAEELPGVRRFGMNGHLYRGDPHNGNAPDSRIRFDDVAQVCEDAPEVEKNAALASRILGEPAPRTLPYPRIETSGDEHLRLRAAEIVAEVGLTPGAFWLACVTGTANVALKAWHRERWAETLSQWARKRDQRFLFVGLASEAADVQAVRDAMPDGLAESHTRVWMPEHGTIDELIGLAALSSGYFGHDTGPMHVAAAVGKPVLAVFGGGHKLRFQPAVEPSVTVTVGVSCRGCQWVCSFAESHCVKDVPVDEVIRAADDLEDGHVSGRAARVLEPSAELQARMIRESAAVAQERLRTAVEVSRQLHGVQESWERDVADLRAQRDARAAHAEALAGQVAAHENAVQQAHEQLGAQLREKESMIRQQDEQLREKETALRAQHVLLQEQNETLHRTSAEAETRAARLTADLDARAEELTRIRRDFDAKSDEASRLAALTDAQRGAIDRLQADLTSALARMEETARANADAAKSQSEDIGKLRDQLQRLEERVRIIEPVRRPRRPLKQVLVDFIIGPQHYYPPPPKSLPGVTVVTVVGEDCDPRALRETIQSVVNQTHAHVQYVIVDRGADEAARAVLDAFRGDIDKVIAADAGPHVLDALAQGYAQATYDLLGRLDAGDLYEPGALIRVAEHFRDHPRHKAAVFEDVIGVGDGWRFPAPQGTGLDVYTLLADPQQSDTATSGIFVTTNAYKSLSGINHERGDAAEWDFAIRLARRFGIARGRGHARTRRPRPVKSSDTRRQDFSRAREAFETSFGPAGRARCKLIHWVNRAAGAIGRIAQPRDRMDFAVDFPEAVKPPAGTAPADVPADQPVCPLDGRLPDRLLFSTRDTLGGDAGVNYVYLDSAANAALVYPPLDSEKLQAICQKIDRAEAKTVTPPDADRVSPYAGYRGPAYRIASLLSRVRSPYWWFRRPDFGDTSVAELLNSLDGHVPQRGVSVRFLNIGCFEGQVLDALKEQTDWTLFGSETNPAAAAAARGKGHTVWETSAEDAAFAIPLGQQFDVIYLARLLEHLPDPLLVMRRLRQILAPGGRVVIDTPNLDSKLLDVFGPTWSQWQAPYHRTLLGRRGLRTLAKLASFEVERLRTRTHPLAAVRSVHLNDLGLGAVVPGTAEFPPNVASRGVLLAGWARLLWDWRGRGDYLYAVLRAE